MTVLLLLLLAVADPAPPPVPRVGLAVDEGADARVTRRLADELRATGMVVVGPEAAGAVCLVHVAATTVTVVAAGTSTAFVIDEDRELLALLVVERVRATLLVPKEPVTIERVVVQTVPTEQQRAPSAPPAAAAPISLRGSVDGRALLYLGGVPAVPAADVHIAARPFPFLEVGAQLGMPLAPGQLDVAQAEAQVLLSQALVTVAVPLRLHDRFELAVGAAVGPLWLHTEGEGKAGATGIVHDALITSAQLDGTARVRLWEGLWAEAGVVVAAVTPRPILVVDEAQVASLDRVGAGVFGGVSFHFPETVEAP